MSKLTKEEIEQWLDQGISVKHRKIYLGSTIDDESAERFIKQIQLLDSISDEQIEVVMNCEGGSTLQGQAMIDAIEHCRSYICIDVIGQCQSMAVQVLQAADERRMYPGALLMMHVGEVSYGTMHPTVLQAWRVWDEGHERRMVDQLSERMETPMIELLELLEFDTIYSAEEALDVGLIDSIIGGE